MCWKNEPCPFLPVAERVFAHDDLAALGAERGPSFYVAALLYAQSQWRLGFPARSLLLCSRAMAADLNRDDEILRRCPMPYSAVAWLLANRREGQFFGNPRLHFQHLASRMPGPNKELRAWRAWACWYLAKELLDPREFPGDWEQIRREGLVEPTRDTIGRRLQSLSSLGDEPAWQDALRGFCKPPPALRSGGGRSFSVRTARQDDMGTIRALAESIWPRVYSDIISLAQIHYMLDRFYDPEVMWQEVERRGVCFALIECAGRTAGYLSFEPLRAEQAAFIHKLYLLPEFHGMGAGAAALGWVGRMSARAGLRKLKLRVNKRNMTAIRAYLRSGFAFAGEEVTDIGDGFVMDDYWMEKAVG